MKKNVIALLWCAIVVLPVFGIFTTGGTSILEALCICDGGPTLTNLLSLLYLAFIVLVKFPAPRWICEAVDAMVSDDSDTEN